LSRRYFNEVIRSRADSPLGYSGLADADVAVYDYVCKDAGCRGIVSQARRSAAAALKRDPQSPEAHTSYGMILWDMNRDYRGAEREFKSALAIDRHYALAHQWYGSLLLADGRSREALTELQAASNDNPIATATYAWAAMAAYFGDRFEDAVMLSNEALRFDPRRADSIVIRALAFRRLAGDRRAAEALQTLRGVRKVSQLTPVMQRFGDTCHVDDAGLSCDWRLIAR
jgi:tetratricopeptide (TPR) repeat protein